MAEINPHKIYGLMAEFEDPDSLVEASRQARDSGYTKLDAYSPFPIEELHEALKLKKPILPKLVLLGAILGALTGFILQYYTSVEVYPLNIGGRPLNSWPSFIVITFELAILFAAGTAVFGMFALNGLPSPYHPVFNVERFALASRDRFFLCIESRDPKFHIEETRAFLLSLQPDGVFEVDP